MLFHGWGFDASIWDAVVACLPGDACVRRMERGYFGARPAAIWPEGPRGDVVAVGHSMGLLHALRAAAGEPPGAILAINGFTRFCAGPESSPDWSPDWSPGVPARVPARMLSRMRQAPEEVVGAFRASQGAAPAVPVLGPESGPESGPDSGLNPGRLAEDLGWLIEADLRAIWQGFAGPVCALAGADDHLIEAAHARACFGEALRFCEGGHLLPSTDPVACASAIATLASLL